MCHKNLLVYCLANSINNLPSMEKNNYNLHQTQTYQTQANGNQPLANGSSKPTLVEGDMRSKSKYSFRRNMSFKLAPEVKTGFIEQSNTNQLKEDKIENTVSFIQKEQKIQKYTNNAFNQFPNQSNIVFTPRPTPHFVSIQTNHLPPSINIAISPSPARPNIMLTHQPNTAPTPSFVIPPPQQQPTIGASQPQLIVIPPPQSIMRPQQPEPFIKPPQPIISPFVPISNAPVNAESVESSQNFIKQIRELKQKIESLQNQKAHLFEQIANYQRQRFDNKSQEALRVCKQEIQHLKERIAQISQNCTPSAPIFVKNDEEMEELKQKLIASLNREKQYQQKLIQAQNQIILLETINHSKSQNNHQTFENEIKELRQIISNYSKHLQNIELQKQEYKKYLNAKQQQLIRLYEQNSALNAHLQQAKNTSQNGINPNEYYSLLAQFGKKDMQVIILMAENSRLHKVTQDLKTFLVKAEDYIVQLQEKQTNAHSSPQVRQSFNKESDQIQVLNAQINELYKKIQAQQLKTNDYKSEIQNLTDINLQQTQQISVFKTQINDYKSQITRSQSQSNTERVRSQANNTLLIDLGKKQLQVIILLEQINRLNCLRVQLVNHLQQAEQYIFGAQQYIKQLEFTSNASPSANSSQVQDYKYKIQELEVKLALAFDKISTFEAKQTSHFKQMQGLQLKYKGIIAQFDKNYSQLQQQKNSLTEKIKMLNHSSLKVANDNFSSQQALELQQTNKRLNIQLAQITGHLVNAEQYIRANSQKWNKNDFVSKQLSENVEIMQLLNSEIQITKDQNLALNDRNIKLHQTIQELSTAQLGSQNMTIVIRQKEEVEVLQADRHAQIQQLWLSLNNYIILYNEAQAKLKLAEKQLQNYKLQMKKLSELEAYIKKTDDLLSEQEQRWSTSLKNYEIENLQIKNHLIGAEIYIKELQQKCSKLSNDFLKMQQQNKLYIKENVELNEALNKAQLHIYEMEKVLNIRKS